MKNNYYYDVVIIGSGAAGLTTALNLAKHHKVAILTKGELNDNNTMHAQGGIAAVVADDDSIESHIQDTLVCGAGRCDEAAVRFVVSKARAAITWLVAQGVQFNQQQSEQGARFHATQEGGHSRRRVLHTNDTTGLEIGSNLIKQMQARPNDLGADILAQHTAIDLMIQDNGCVGVYALNNHTQAIVAIYAKCVVLATGGASRVYQYTSNPDGATGDGIAMAARAGCKIRHMEFNQFHPTCLYHPGAKAFLISEALRGEGAILTLPDGERFMTKFDARGELAPRDIVTRAIVHEMHRLGLEHVYLDISHKGADFVKQHFPAIHQTCLKFGFDITRQAIPIAPAAHYTCGGVVVDLNGRTNLSGLYAIGETACTGLHGANRLASNSLLECIVYGKAVSEDIDQYLSTTSVAPFWHSEVDNTANNLILALDGAVTSSASELDAIRHHCAKIREWMWHDVGIVRSNQQLKHAQAGIELLKLEFNQHYIDRKVSQDLLELYNLITIADLITNAAIGRQENCGLHYNVDLG